MDVGTYILRGIQCSCLWSGLSRITSYSGILTHEPAELASRLDALKNDTDVPPATIQAITSDLSRLTKSLSDVTGSLPSYDQRQYELVSCAISIEEFPVILSDSNSRR